MNEGIETHPVQTNAYQRGQAKLPKVVTMKAYEVYCAVFGEQEKMVTGDCRGGFGAGELIAFLYAHSFPKEQWRDRVNEALAGAKNL